MVVANDRISPGPWNDVVDDVAVRVDVVGDLRVAVRPVLRLPDDHPHVRIDRAVRSGVG